MPNTPRGLTYPLSSASAALWTHLENLATTADTAIGALATTLAGRYEKSVAAFANLAGVASPFAGMRVWVVAEKRVYTYNGTAWVADPIIRRGTDSLTPVTVDVLVSKTVTFATPFPTGIIPTVVVSLAAMASGTATTKLYAASETETGFSANLIRGTTTATAFRYIAIAN